jgi:hypothetical protein
MSITYFATDGSFGDAAGIIIVDTTLWSDDDWLVIADTTDDDRSLAALRLHQSHEVGAQS